MAFKGIGSMTGERIALARAGALRAEEARCREIAAQMALFMGGGAGSLSGKRASAPAYAVV